MTCPKNTDYTVGSVLHFMGTFIFLKMHLKKNVTARLLSNKHIFVTFNVHDLIPAALTVENRLIMNIYACRHELHWIVVAAVQSRDFPCYINSTLHSSSTLLSPTFRAVVSWFSLVNQLFPVWAFELRWLFLWLYWTSFMVGMLSCTWCEVRRWVESRAQDEWCQKWASENLIIDLCDASCVHFLRIFWCL